MEKIPEQPKKDHGGKRSKSGRKLLYGEPTKMVSFAVPVSKIEEFKKDGYARLAKWVKPPADA